MALPVLLRLRGQRGGRVLAATARRHRRVREPARTGAARTLAGDPLDPEPCARSPDRRADPAGELRAVPPRDRVPDQLDQPVHPALRGRVPDGAMLRGLHLDRKSTRLNSSHANISYAVFCLKKKTTSN